MIGFIIGVFVGVIFGVVIMALMAAVKGFCRRYIWRCYNGAHGCGERRG